MGKDQKGEGERMRKWPSPSNLAHFGFGKRRTLVGRIF
jgi:hypothetical protein